MSHKASLQALWRAQLCHPRLQPASDQVANSSEGHNAPRVLKARCDALCLTSDLEAPVEDIQERRALTASWCAERASAPKARGIVHVHSRLRLWQRVCFTRCCRNTSLLLPACTSILLS